jgi:hypothetical protein
MISDTTAIIFLVALIALAAFATWLLRYRSTLLLPKIYLMVALCYAIWVMALLVMKFISAGGYLRAFYAGLTDVCWRGQHTGAVPPYCAGVR